VTHVGGNAGAAATYCAKLLNKPILVVVPESTPDVVVKKLEDGGAEVLVFGKVTPFCKLITLTLWRGLVGRR